MLPYELPSYWLKASIESLKQAFGQAWINQPNAQRMSDQLSQFFLNIDGYSVVLSTYSYYYSHKNRRSGADKQCQFFFHIGHALDG